MYSTRQLGSSIVYISTNFYHMGFSLALKTDYKKSLYEKNIVEKVLNRLPHKVQYKTYPVDNRRYADPDPILSSIKKADNIELFSEKIDMRYLIYKHRVLVTTCATSTLSWPIMSGKPVIFINQKENSPLSGAAHASLSSGIFVFDDVDPNFHENLKRFLSKSIDEIERLWDKKKNNRERMIKDYFSEYDRDAGVVAAKILYKKYLS